MIMKTLLGTALIGLSFSAAAQFVTVTKAHEIALSNFRAPGTVSGNATFKNCADCDPYTVPVTPDTRYSINDEAATLASFRDTLARVVNRSRTAVIVHHHLESDTIVAINVWMPAR